jgi:multiple sugar transport system substrate-binding protein
MRRVWIALACVALIGAAWTSGTWASPARTNAGATQGKITGCSAKGTVSYMFWGDKGDKAVQDKVIALAEAACPGLHVTPIWDQGNYDNDLATKIGSGNAPDLFQLDGAKRISEFVSKGAVAPLDSFLKRDKVNLSKIYWGNCLPLAVRNKHVYGLMRTCGNQSLLYYNKDMFDARHVKYPTANWTYKDFLSAAEKLSGNYSLPTDSSSKLRYGYGWNNDDFRINQFIWMWGGDWLSKDLHTCTLTSKPAQQALQWLVDLRYKYHGAPTAEQAGEAGGYFDGFRNQRYAMAFMGAWAYDYALGKGPVSTTTPPTFHWGLTLNPLGPKSRQSVVAATFEEVSSRSPNKNAAYWLARFVTQGKAGALVGAYGIDIPGNQTLINDPRIKAEYGSNLKVIIASNKYGRELRAIPRYDEFVNTLETDLDPMFKNQASVASATQKACSDLTPLLP